MEPTTEAPATVAHYLHVPAEFDGPHATEAWVASLFKRLIKEQNLSEKPLLPVDRRMPGPKLAAALAKAQGFFTNIKKDREVEVTPKDATKRSYKFSYATLAAIWTVIRKPLADAEISVLQYPTVHHREGAASMYIEVTTYLTHSSGECVVGTIEIPFASREPQAIGIIISYCKRYALNAMLGLAQEDESDEVGSSFDGPPPMANLTPSATVPRAAKKEEVPPSKPAQQAAQAAAGAASPTPPGPTSPPAAAAAPTPQGEPAAGGPTEADFHLQFEEAKTEPDLTRVGASINEVKHTLSIEEQARLTAKFKKRREEIRKGA